MALTFMQNLQAIKGFNDTHSMKNQEIQMIKNYEIVLKDSFIDGADEAKNSSNTKTVSRIGLSFS